MRKSWLDHLKNRAAIFGDPGPYVRGLFQDRLLALLKSPPKVLWPAVAALVLAGLWAWRPDPRDPTPVVARNLGLRAPTAEEEGDVSFRTPASPQAAHEDRSSPAPRSPGAPLSRPGQAPPGGASREASALRERTRVLKPDPSWSASPARGHHSDGGARALQVEAARHGPHSVPSSPDSGGTREEELRGDLTAPAAEGTAAATGSSEGPGPQAQGGQSEEQALTVDAAPEKAGPGDTRSPTGSAEPAPPAQATLVPPRPLYAPLPEHPGMKVTVAPLGGLASASVVGREGRVRVKLLVRADGSVGRVDVLASSGDPELDRATVAAMSRWRFDPARRGGTPVDSYYVVWVRFVAGP